MRFALFCLLFFCLLAVFAMPAHAQQMEARAVALQNGCRPTKIDILQQTYGAAAEVTYSFTCENKAAGANAAEPKMLKIRCKGRQCVALN